MISLSSADEDKDRSSAVSAAWAQCPGIWASALDHAQPISCKHNRSVGTALKHVTQGSYKPLGKPQGREARDLQKLIGVSTTMALVQPRGVHSRNGTRGLSCELRSLPPSCSFLQVDAALNDLGGLVLPKWRVFSPVRPSLAGRGPHGMFIWLGHWCFPSRQHLLPAVVN